jgi:hypothetical protein
MKSGVLKERAKLDEQKRIETEARESAEKARVIEDEAMRKTERDRRTPTARQA